MNATNAFNTQLHICVALLFGAGSAFAQLPALPSAGAPSCVISEFMNMALTTHEPVARTNQAKAWLAKNGPLCNPKQLEILKANRANWLGTSDNVDIFSLIFAIQEENAKSNPSAMNDLFGFSGVNPIVPRKDEGISSKPKGATAGPGAPGAGAPSPFGQPASPFGQPASPFGMPASPFGQPASPFGPPSPFGQPASPFGNPASPSANPFAPK